MAGAADIRYCTHEVGGRSFGCWYKVNGDTSIEILSLFLIETVPLEGTDPDAKARVILERIVARIGLDPEVKATMTADISAAPR